MLLHGSTLQRDGAWQVWVHASDVSKYAHNIHPLLRKSEPELMNLMKSMLVSSLARTSGRVMQAGSTGREPSIALLGAGLPATLQLWAQPFPNHLMSFFLVWGQCCCDSVRSAIPVLASIAWTEESNTWAVVWQQKKSWTLNKRNEPNSH